VAETSLATLQARLAAINTALDAYYADIVVEVSHTEPNGASVRIQKAKLKDLEDTRANLERQVAALEGRGLQFLKHLQP